MGKLAEPWKCSRGHTVAAWLTWCHECVTKRPNNVTPCDESGGVPDDPGAPRSGPQETVGSTPARLHQRGRPKKYKNRAERQRAYRERR